MSVSTFGLAVGVKGKKGRGRRGGCEGAGAREWVLVAKQTKKKKR